MIRNLTELYHEQLQDLFSAETQMIEGLPKLIASASNGRLKRAFSAHLDETKIQRDRIERMCVRRSVQPGDEECQAMRGLMKEACKDIGNTEEGPVRDAVLIAAANRIEHYEIAGYGVARAYAECLGLDEDVRLLTDTLEEEASADRKLTEIATGSLFKDGINEDAVK